MATAYRTTLNPRLRYSLDVIRPAFAGWSVSGLHTGSLDGYHLDNYFDGDRYVGPDQDGVEPLFDVDADVAADLFDYNTTDVIRPATCREYLDSLLAAEHDGGAGIIEVDGRSCYVE